jgi:hypothetical protein
LEKIRKAVKTHGTLNEKKELKPVILSEKYSPAGIIKQTDKHKTLEVYHSNSFVGGFKRNPKESKLNSHKFSDVSSDAYAIEVAKKLFGKLSRNNSTVEVQDIKKYLPYGTKAQEVYELFTFDPKFPVTKNRMLFVVKSKQSFI